MQYKHERNFVVTRVLLGALLSIFLVSCGNGPGPTSSNSSIPPTSTRATAALGLNVDKSFDLSPLSIHAPGFTCDVDSFIPFGKGTLVFTENPTSYDAGSIAALTRALDNHDPSLLPNGFADVLGSFVGPQAGYCFTTWELTNTSRDIVQVTGMMLHYTASRRPNDYQYKLIDSCPLPIQPQAKFCSPRGGGITDLAYSFTVGMGDASTVLTGTPVGSSQSSATFTLNPGETVKVDLSVNTPSSQDQAYIYSLYPEISLSTSSREETLEITQMTNTLAFTDRSHISCYQLQSNNTFVQITDPSLIPNPPDYHVDCI